MRVHISEATRQLLGDCCIVSQRRLSIDATMLALDGRPLRFGTYYVDRLTETGIGLISDTLRQSKENLEEDILTPRLIARLSVSTTISEQQGDVGMLNRWIVGFRDPIMEFTYQMSYVRQCGGKFGIAVVVLICVFLLILGARFLTGYESPVFLIDVSFVLFLLSLIAIIASAPYWVEVFDTPFAYTISRVCFALSRFQILGPVCFLLVFFGATFDSYLCSDPTCPFEFTISSVYVILLTCTAFIRLRSLWTSLTALVIAVTFIVLGFTVKSSVFGRYYPSAIPYMTAIVVAVALINRRMDLAIRRNYIMKRSVAEKAHEVDALREKSEMLLKNLLPRPIIERLKAEPRRIIADNISEAAILFCSIPDFTEFNAETVKILNEIVCQFDRVCEMCDVDKVKTIGNVYMAASGTVCPGIDGDFLEKLANFAVTLLKRISTFNAANGSTYSLRIGMSMGPLVAGVIGRKKVRCRCPCNVNVLC